VSKKQETPDFSRRECHFNPALIADLRTRAFQGIAEIQQKVKA
jgi:hypothetical protein